jgi:hypothetical protein
MPYPQNLGLAAAVDRLRQRNQMNAMQGQSPAGIYATSPDVGHMTNDQAYDTFQRTGGYAGGGYMPNRTVGGAYGLTGHDPMGANRLTQPQVLQQATGNQYAPMGAAANNNLGGTLWGGAQPGMVAGNPAWVNGPERMASAGALPNTRYIGGGVLGRTQLAPISQGDPVYDRMQAAKTQFDARGGGLAARQQAYQERIGATGSNRAGVLARVGIRAQNAQAAQQNALAMQQQQMMMGLAMRNPAMAMGLAQLNQRGQLAQQQMGLQYAQLNQQGGIAGQNSKDRRYVADRGVDAANMQAWNQARLALMKEGHSPADVNAYLGPPPATPGSAPGVAGPAPGGLMQPSPVAQGGYKPKRALLDAQVAQVASLPKAKREAALRAMGVTDPGDLHHYQSQLDPKYKEQTGLGALADWLFRPPMDQPGYKSPGIFYRDNPK